MGINYSSTTVFPNYVRPREICIFNSIFQTHVKIIDLHACSQDFYKTQPEILQVTACQRLCKEMEPVRLEFSSFL